MSVTVRVLVLTAVFAIAAAAPAAARDAVVRSFDGTEIHVTLHPAAGLKAPERAPTILQTHGWAGTRQRDPEAATSESTGNVGVGPLRRAGFNVLTWDSRGFGESGGTVMVDSKDFEGRDVQALLDWLADQPEATLDGPNDPRVGMHGVSYAGGIELVSAAIDDRIEAIAPSIAWHSLLTSLYKANTVKGGWSSLLYATGQSSGRLDPHIASAAASGLTTGTLSAEDRAWFAARGPGDALVRRIRAPTLLLQGTADTLFTTSEAIRNYEILRANRVPVKMMWFCGGHGTCLTGTGPAGHLERRVIAWLRRYVAFPEEHVAVGPGFEWLADDAVWRSAPSWPPPAGAPLVADGSGMLALTALDAVSGSPIVDEKRNVVLGNLVTPLPVTLDGASHTVTRSLEGVAASMTPAGRYRLQVIGGSQVYGPVRGAAAIAVTSARLELPTVGTPRGCRSPERFTLLLPRRGRLRSAKVWVAGKRAKVRRHGGRLRAVVDLRPWPGRRVRVRIVGRTAGGALVRQTRIYRVCS